MKRKLLLTLLALACIFCLAFGLAACTDRHEPTPTEGLEYTLNDGGASYSCTGIGTTDETDIVIAKEYEGLPVTSIGKNAFKQCTNLTSITIPSSVTSIGKCAFGDCTSLTSVTFGKNSKLTSIGEDAFEFCRSLTSITIPNSVTSISQYAFVFCRSLTSVTFEKNSKLTSIGDSAFEQCTNLTSVTFGKNSKLTYIGWDAFDTCTSLTSITIPASVTSIGPRAFMCCTSLTSITIPNSVTSIGDSAFVNCSGLESLAVAKGNPQYHSEGNCIIKTDTKTLVLGCKNSTIPDSVTNIGLHAFEFCTSLTSITIPNSVTAIRDSAFNQCTSLENVYYTGTAEQWKKININYHNNSLTSATIYYYREENPFIDGMEEGNFWHYVDGEVVVWVKEDY